MTKQLKLQSYIYFHDKDVQTYRFSNLNELRYCMMNTILNSELLLVFIYTCQQIRNKYNTAFCTIKVVNMVIT